MTPFEWASLIIPLTAFIFIPVMVYVWRQGNKLERVVDKVGELAEDVSNIQRSQMEVQKSTDRRIRWLEENIWTKNGGRRW